MTDRAPVLGGTAIAIAILFNVPYAVLAFIFDYPAILRSPANEVLSRFAAGGPMLVLVWYSFAISALALTPLAIGLSVSSRRLRESPALALGAAITGALAGLVQAIGLLRWVFVVPLLAHQTAHGATLSAVQSFELIHAYGGVAIGEHLGQLLTALFVGQLSLLQVRDHHRVTAVTGMVTATALVIGTGEGLAIVLGNDGGQFALATILGFLGLTAWLIATGLTLIRRH